MLSIKQVSEMLNVTAQTVRNLANGEVIPAYRIGGQIRFREQDVLAYLDRQKIKVTEVKEAE
ncbi:Helix-turn-helix domain protein [Gimesia panareensis]|uniref:Helix-turn-helix domain protein n=1 Tax=Gimesia panareensis TaxID=2527978 RepID=A0A518FT11_9PLAN|nr:Helix-turn-helix domain protein [Gimesia panareensis]